MNLIYFNLIKKYILLQVIKMFFCLFVFLFILVLVNYNNPTGVATISYKSYNFHFSL